MNSLAWNAQGTLLISGSDDTRVCAVHTMSICSFSSQLLNDAVCIMLLTC